MENLIIFVTEILLNIVFWDFFAIFLNNCFFFEIFFRNLGCLIPIIYHFNNSKFSSVTRTNFHDAKNFVKDVSSVFDLRNGNVRVGVITYETHVTTTGAIKLGAVHSQDAFNNEVDEMPYTGGDTHTGEALE